MWEEAESQVTKRRLGKPIRLTEEGRLVNDLSLPVNPASRSPVDPPGKIRSVGDLKQGTLNRPILIETPMQLPYLGQVVSMVKSIQFTARAWPFGGSWPRIGI